METKKITIPEDFMIGTSSSAWQIEGTFDKKAGQESWAELFYESAPEKWHNKIYFRAFEPTQQHTAFGKILRRSFTYGYWR